MDRGSKPCRTLESTTWGYFEDSGRAVSAEQIPPSYRKMAQLGFRHQAGRPSLLWTFYPFYKRTQNSILHFKKGEYFMVQLF